MFSTIIKERFFLNLFLEKISSMPFLSAKFLNFLYPLTFFLPFLIFSKKHNYKQKYKLKKNSFDPMFSFEKRY